jgi:O-antigen/teichoic acid export membrane protein
MLTESSTAYRYNLSTRGIMGGLFVGIAAAVINLAFDFVYRKITGYEFAEYININSIIFFTIPTLLVGGIIYSILLHYFKRGMIIYITLCILLTIVVAFIPLGPHMMPTGEAMPPSARGLTMGIEIITGAMGAFAIPYFAEHPKVWGD